MTLYFFYYDFFRVFSSVLISHSKGILINICFCDRQSSLILENFVRIFFFHNNQTPVLYWVAEERAVLHHLLILVYSISILSHCRTMNSGV